MKVGLIAYSVYELSLTSKQHWRTRLCFYAWNYRLIIEFYNPVEEYHHRNDPH